MQLRPATPDDLQILNVWNEKAHVIAASPTDGGLDWAYELPRTVSWREILIGEIQGRPIGVVVIIDPEREETHYWGEIAANLRAIDIWIGNEKDLGQGHGSEMMRVALARCFADPAVTAVLIDPLTSNERACRFYERIGFTFMEQRTFGLDDCSVYRIERTVWQRRRHEAH